MTLGREPSKLHIIPASLRAPSNLVCVTCAMTKPLAGCVLLADRHHALSEGIRSLLETTFSSVFLVADEASLIEGAARLQPAVVVVDLSLGADDMFGLVRNLRERAPNAKVLLLSVHDEPTIARSAAAAGADGVVLKRAIATELLPAVDTVLAGQRYTSPTAVR